MTPPHGTRARYGAPHRCRCALCRDAAAAYNRDWRADIRGTTPPSHGLSGYANYACRCPICRQAMADYHQRRRRTA